MCTCIYTLLTVHIYTTLLIIMISRNMENNCILAWVKMMVNIVFQLQSAIIALCGYMKIKYVTAEGYIF